MAKRSSPKGFADDIGKDLRSEIEIHYNQLIKEVINDLTFGVKGKPVSPVLTGFFASSWKASTKQIKTQDARASYSPWSKIRTVRVEGKTQLAAGQKPRFKIRHYVPQKFRLTDPVGIGNTAEYTEYALVSNKSRLIDYILGAGGLDEKIDKIFTDKNRPKVSIQAEGGGTPYQSL